MMKSDDYIYCARQARERDYGRYLCALSAPSHLRNALFALLAFNDELGKIREIVSEPMLGDIRLAWWRETLIAGKISDAGSHPVARELTLLLGQGTIDSGVLEAMIDGRARDFDPEPLRTVVEIEQYALHTAGSLALAMAKVLDIPKGESMQATTEVALAWALIGILRSEPHRERAGRRMLAREMAYKDILDRAEDLLIAARGRARQMSREMSRKAQPLLLPARLCDPWLTRLREHNGNPYKADLEFAPLTPIWRVISGRLSGKY